ncbi:MAG: hypothetical protein JWN40_29 [Phycisphaerales bacterium]|nr:hypothetical protein [Phycisphaerales bacterium]
MSNPGAIFDELLPLLITPELIYFPIRHHSPACAYHLRRLILDVKPSALLVEGPDSFDPLIPLILHEKTRPPIAIYTSYIDKQGRLVPPELAAALAASTGKKPDPARFAGYYPFCDYSPELVALRIGQHVGATLRFIDLTYPEQLLSEREELAAQPNPRARSLLEESHLRRSQYLQALAKRTGCRDPNDLWDHLFESDGSHGDPREFIHRVAAYCAMARIEYTPEALASDGTLAREQAMAAHVADQLAKNRAAGVTAPIIVVTGGFHTAALPMIVPQSPKRPKPLKLNDDETQTAIMRYSFERLDALNGYSAGMPSPHYYNRLWQQMTPVATQSGAMPKNRRKADAQDSALRTQDLSSASQIAAEFLVHIGRLSREKNLPFALSTADEIAALEHCRRIATLRGHAGPTREDLLDAVRSCFVKGDMAVEGSAVMSVVGAILSGTDIGDIPPDAGVPPIVEDFRRIAEKLNLNITDSVRKRVSLDIYRKSAHRQVSRLLHTLTFLHSPFAVLAGGPDFVTGRGLELLHEHWEYGWTPMTESALIEASVFGSTLEEAATNRLKQTIADLESAGQARSTVAAVRTLISACRMGLHRHVDDLLDLIDDNVNNDPSFPSLVSGLNELALLWQSREPLEAHKLPQVPVLAQTAYRKACFLAANLGGCSEQETEQALTALATLREAIHLDDAPAADAEASAAPLNLFDPPLFFEPLRTLLAITTAANPTILGGAVGILFTEGQITEEELLTLAIGQLNSTTINFSTKTAFLRGLLHTAREAAWRLPGLLHALDRLFGDWTDDAFTQSLPDLRLAFSSLTPRETDRVAELIAGLHGQKTLGPLHHRDLTEAEFAFNVRLNAGVVEALLADHLAWKE